MKKLLIAIAGISLVLVIGVATLLAVVDPNEYKPQIAKVVNDSTGREFDIRGDIEWQLFPTFGLSLSDITFSNPEGFQNPYMASLKELTVSVSVLPLLSGTIEVGGITIDQVRLNLLTLADGRNNLDDLTQGADSKDAESKEVAPGPESQEKSTKLDLSQISLGRVLIQDIQLLVDDQQVGTQQQLTLELFELSQIKPGEKSEAKLKLQLNTVDLAAKITVNSAMTISPAFDHIKLHNLEALTHLTGEVLPKGELTQKVTAQGDIQLTDLAVNLEQLKLDVANLQGEGGLKFKQNKVPELDFELNFDTFNLADFVPPASEQKTEQDAPNADTDVAASSESQEPDLTGLKGINITGLVTVKKALAQGVTIQDIRLNLALKDGVLDAKPLQAKLYDGSLNVNAQLNAQYPIASYAADVKLNGVQLLPLLKDATELELLAGVANFNLDLHGTGLSVEKLKTASVGKGDFLVSDGALMGINIPHKIRSIKATLKGKETPAEAKKTDFSSLEGNFSLASGVAHNPNLKLASPLLRVEGKGSFDVLKNSVDYLAVTELVASSKGQGGKSSDDLAGIRIPLRVKGTPDDLSYKLDSESALKQEAKRKVEEKKEEVKKKLDEKKDKLKEKLKGKLGSFFG